MRKTYDLSDNMNSSGNALKSIFVFNLMMTKFRPPKLSPNFFFFVLLFQIIFCDDSVYSLLEFVSVIQMPWVAFLQFWFDSLDARFVSAFRSSLIYRIQNGSKWGITSFPPDVVCINFSQTAYSCKHLLLIWGLMSRYSFCRSFIANVFILFIYFENFGTVCRRFIDLIFIENKFLETFSD